MRGTRAILRFRRARTATDGQRHLDCAISTDCLISPDMTGGGFVLPARGGRHNHDVQWLGKPGVKGPRWGRLPLLTVGMLGLQSVWSIEMGYASPYLLELGLSKSLMSLVFVAGPLSGLIMQPLIGMLADRSKSRLGRRRPWMIGGCAVAVVAMMLLGWAREISNFFGGASTLAIVLAIWAIYLIDFSINAVQATDRALVVDTLPPEQQEAGNAWAGRMFGFGSVMGFFVGNLDLPPALPFLGKTQLQVLSFLTSVILVVTHAFTAWAVQERVLLRDNRPQSQGSFLANLRSIWDNIFTLPLAIRTLCFVQFFSWIGWFPVMFFTTVWVGEIYTAAQPVTEPPVDPIALANQATRAGSRALFVQAFVSFVTSIILPFLVEHSGVQSTATRSTSRISVPPPNSATWKRGREEGRFGQIIEKLKEFRRVLEAVPIRGLTLVNVWVGSQCLFAICMLMTWFVSSVNGAYVVIGMTGFCWAVTQWAPFSLLGELILVDDFPSDTDIALSSVHYPLAADFPLPESRGGSLDVTPAGSQPLSRVHSRLASREEHFKLGDDEDEGSEKVAHTQRSSTPLTVVIRHSDESSRDGFDVGPGLDEETLVHGDDDPESPGRETSGQSTAEKAGVILGIHNIFIVLPQFLVTFISAIIFYLLEPSRSALPVHHAATIPPTSNITVSSTTGDHGLSSDTDLVARWIKREAGRAGSPDSVGLIFRIGGICAAVAAWLCWRMGRMWARGKGI